MKIIFDTIKIENFLSIGEAEISLKDRGYCLVNGVNKNPKDSAKSNGSGKSSIFEAIAWALSGETIRGAKNVVNMFQSGGTLVDLTFQVDKDNYEIIRTKEHKKYKTDLKIYINGEDKSGKTLTDSKKLLANYLPDLTSSLIGSVILLGQGLPQRFTNNTPAGRKEVLEQLSKSDFMIEDLKKRLQDRKCYLNKELRSYEDKLLEIDTTIKSLNNQIETSKIKLSSMGDSSAYDEIINRAKEKISYLDSKLEEIRDSLKDNRLRLDNSLIEKSNIESSLKDQQNEEQKDLIVEKGNLNTQIASLQLEITQLNQEIFKAKNIKDTCPTCGQKLPNVFIPDIKPQEEALQIKKNNLEEIKGNLENLRSKEVEISNKYRDLLVSSTVEINSIITELRGKIQSGDKSVAILNADRNTEQSTLSKYESLKASYQATIELLTKSIQDNESKILKLNEETVYNTEEKKKISSKLEVINKFITVTNRDFRGYLLKNVIAYIDKRAKEYCLEVFNTEDIQFILEGNDINIRYSGKEYEVLSGGEKQKIDMIIQLSLRDMLCQFLNFRSNIIAFDEIFDNMDSEGCDKIINLISKKLNDVGSVFIVTHHQDLNIPNDNIITVVKQENGVSIIA